MPDGHPGWGTRNTSRRHRNRQGQGNRANTRGPRGLDDHFLGRIAEEEENQAESSFVLDTREPGPGTYSYVQLPAEDFGLAEAYPLTPDVSAKALVSLGLPQTLCRLAHLDTSYKLDKPDTKFPVCTRDRMNVLRRLEERMGPSSNAGWYRVVKEELFKMNICPDVILNLSLIHISEPTRPY